jgi:hypothetical protein
MPDVLPSGDAIGLTIHQAATVKLVGPLNTGEAPIVARVLQRDDNFKLLGYLDDPRFRGPLAPGVHHVEFEAWRLRPDDPWLHTDPGPSRGLYQPIPMHAIFKIEAINTAQEEIDLIPQSFDVDFIKRHPSFRAA